MGRPFALDLEVNAYPIPEIKYGDEVQLLLNPLEITLGNVSYLEDRRIYFWKIKRVPHRTRFISLPMKLRRIRLSQPGTEFLLLNQTICLFHA